MKKIFFFCFLMLGAMVSFNACGDEESKPNTNQGADDNTISGEEDIHNSAIVSGTKDNGLELIFKADSMVLGNYSSIDTKWECKFNAENKLTSSVTTITYANDALASAAFQAKMQAIPEDERIMYAVQGNKIIFNDTAKRNGQSKDSVLQEMNRIANTINKNQQQPNSNDSIPGGDYVIPNDSTNGGGYVNPNDSTNGGGYVEPGDSIPNEGPSASIKASETYLALVINYGHMQSVIGCEFEERNGQLVCVKATQTIYTFATGESRKIDVTREYAFKTYNQIMEEFQNTVDDFNNQSNGEFF